MRVLVVDDNATSRDVLKGMLESFSFDILWLEVGKKV